MQFKVPVTGFVLTLAISIGLTQILPVRPLVEWVRPTEWLWPSFSLEEASAMIGQHVRCAYRSDTIYGRCEIGEQGKVLSVEKVPDGGYFIVVYWEGQVQDEPCYYGRYSRRVFLTGD